MTNPDTKNPESQESSRELQTIEKRMRDFISDPENFPFEKKVVFAIGTAPMREDSSEIPFLFAATDFDELVVADPKYAGARELKNDQDQIARDFQVDSESELPQLQEGESHTVTFQHEGKERKVTFVASAVKDKQDVPANMNIFVSGRRVAPQLEEGVVSDIADSLPAGGLLLPDRDRNSDAEYFGSVAAQDMGLEEVPGIRDKVEKKVALDIALENKLRAEQSQKLIEEGKIKPQPIEKILRFQNGTTASLTLEGKDKINIDDRAFEVEEVVHESIDDFFRAHPELSRDAFGIGATGMSTEDAYVEFQLTDTEIKTIQEMEEQAQKDATHEQEFPGIGLYIKVK
ncbi:hypothetical protein ACFL2D_02965 [Patescibacteria group bacterium]